MLKIRLVPGVAWILSALLAVPAGAGAQSASGLYINIDGGANFSAALASPADKAKVHSNAGPSGLIDFGWSFGNGVRAEIEGSVRSNGITGISTRGVGGVQQALEDPTGTLRTYAIMANVRYDLPLGLPFQPYVGAGVGYGWMNFAGAGGNGSAMISGPGGNAYAGPATVSFGSGSFGSGGAFAYQAILGTSMPLPIAPGLEATLEYRFFGLAQTDVILTRTATGAHFFGGGIPSDQQHVGFEVHDNMLLIGLLYRFGGP